MDGPALVADRATVAREAPVAWRQVVARWAAIPRRYVIARGALVTNPGVVAHRPSVAHRAPGRWLLAPRALVVHLFRRGHLARVAVAGRLAAAALLGWRRRLLAAGRRGSVTPLRGRGAFAPRTTRTLGW
ncbi:hypothetical protein [Amycolatopsis nalaikhensis]|uniref:Uncharacterized protein n=1 Tax=Amycolatopsis nalaikhensis TaxID=715472 RepID=A0ABY8XV68_9PSEU|nr:hypothetical protein [Amycolatopsis sp. 2-2]WIV59589.1 hypothetical protein QP939_13730 [Amycolatopsis sp. 2-2]